MCAHHLLVCEIKMRVKGGEGDSPKPLNWGIMAFKTLMELSGRSLWSAQDNIEENDSDRRKAK